jgi:hypothetical protein
MTTPTDLPAVYRRAIEVIKTNGWIQGWLYDPAQSLPHEQCRVCLLGAVGLAMLEQPGEPWISFEEELRDLGPIIVALGLTNRLNGEDTRPMQVLGTWNDAPDRTVDEVLDALERAAVAAESGGAA